jgi:uncharacterized protein
MNAFVIDAFEFCRLKERREGEIAVADLPRLAAETADSSGILRWSLQGGMHAVRHPQLTLTVTGPVRLMCQRCLTPFTLDIVSGSTLVLAPDEASVDAIETLVDDDEIDVIAGSRSMKILDLVEDEALLSLPISPRHDACPDQAMLDALNNKEKVSPFAVLKKTQ